MKQVGLVIPVFNKSSSLPEFTLALLELVTNSDFNFHVLFVDDGSTDNSVKVIEEFVLNHPFADLIKGENEGKGAALRKGFNRILKENKMNQKLKN
jgi:glycosyltransferase involved in cell wall biosynthesis